MPNESTITTKVLKYLNKQPQCLFIKKHNNQYARKGEPDILGCVSGRFVAIEMKIPGKEPTPIQYKRLREWEQAGAVAFWATSLEEVLEKLREGGIEV